MKTKELLKEIKGVFKPPTNKYYLGRLAYGTPYMYPRNFNPRILTIRKEKKQYNRNKTFKLFNYYISIGWPIYFYKGGLGWKWKYDMVRFEWSPVFQIYLFGLQFVIFYDAPDGNDDLYYEMILHYLKKSDKDIDVARKTWGWVNMETNKSTWNDNYLIKK